MVESILFITYYNFGPRGMHALYELKKSKAFIQDDIEKIKEENDDLRNQIEDWKHDLFLQEKFAREKLALQKENEIIYFT
jgi:cell division protein FtsB